MHPQRKPAGGGAGGAAGSPSSATAAATTPQQQQQQSQPHGVPKHLQPAHQQLGDSASPSTRRYQQHYYQQQQSALREHPQHFSSGQPHRRAPDTSPTQQQQQHQQHQNGVSPVAWYSPGAQHHAQQRSPSNGGHGYDYDDDVDANDGAYSRAPAQQQQQQQQHPAAPYVHYEQNRPVVQQQQQQHPSQQHAGRSPIYHHHPASSNHHHHAAPASGGVSAFSASRRGSGGGGGNGAAGDEMRAYVQRQQQDPIALGSSPLPMPYTNSAAVGGYHHQHSPHPHYAPSSSRFSSAGGNPSAAHRSPHAYSINGNNVERTPPPHQQQQQIAPSSAARTPLSNITAHHAGAAGVPSSGGGNRYGASPAAPRYQQQHAHPSHLYYDPVDFHSSPANGGLLAQQQYIARAPTAMPSMHFDDPPERKLNSFFPSHFNSARERYEMHQQQQQQQQHAAMQRGRGGGGGGGNGGVSPPHDQQQADIAPPVIGEPQAQTPPAQKKKESRVPIDFPRGHLIRHDLGNGDAVVYVVDSKLGSGSFADVFAVTNQATGERFACKVLPRTEDGGQTFAKLNQEVHIHSRHLWGIGGPPAVTRLRNQQHASSGASSGGASSSSAFSNGMDQQQQQQHLASASASDSNISGGSNSLRNIVRCYSVFIERGKYLYMILEYCENKDLAYLLREAQGRLTEAEVQYLMVQLICAVDSLHARQVIHRDLKLANLLLDGNLHLKVGDFGLSAQLSHHDEKKRTQCGTPNYIAPEILNSHMNGGYSFQADIWSIGVILYALCVGHPPFETECKNVNLTYANIRNCAFTIPDTVSPAAARLIRRILQADPARRPSLVEIRCDPFLAQVHATTAPPPMLRHRMELRRKRYAEKARRHMLQQQQQSAEAQTPLSQQLQQRQISAPTPTPTPSSMGGASPTGLYGSPFGAAPGMSPLQQQQPQQSPLPPQQAAHQHQQQQHPGRGNSVSPDPPQFSRPNSPVLAQPQHHPHAHAAGGGGVSSSTSSPQSSNAHGGGAQFPPSVPNSGREHHLSLPQHHQMPLRSASEDVMDGGGGGNQRVQQPQYQSQHQQQLEMYRRQQHELYVQQQQQQQQSRPRMFQPQPQHAAATLVGAATTSVTMFGTPNAAPPASKNSGSSGDTAAAASSSSPASTNAAGSAVGAVPGAQGPTAEVIFVSADQTKDNNNARSHSSSSAAAAGQQQQQQQQPPSLFGFVRTYFDLWRQVAPPSRLAENNFWVSLLANVHDGTLLPPASNLQLAGAAAPALASQPAAGARQQETSGGGDQQHPLVTELSRFLIDGAVNVAYRTTAGVGACFDDRTQIVMERGTSRCEYFPLERVCGGRAGGGGDEGTASNTANNGGGVSVVRFHAESDRPPRIVAPQKLQALWNVHHTYRAHDEQQQQQLDAPAAAAATTTTTMLRSPLSRRPGPSGASSGSGGIATCIPAAMARIRSNAAAAAESRWFAAPAGTGSNINSGDVLPHVRYVSVVSCNIRDEADPPSQIVVAAQRRLFLSSAATQQAHQQQPQSHSDAPQWQALMMLFFDGTVQISFFPVLPLPSAGSGRVADCTVLLQNQGTMVSVFAAFAEGEPPAAAAAAAAAAASSGAVRKLSLAAPTPASSFRAFCQIPVSEAMRCLFEMQQQPARSSVGGNDDARAEAQVKTQLVGSWFHRVLVTLHHAASGQHSSDMLSRLLGN